MVLSVAMLTLIPVYNALAAESIADSIDPVNLAWKATKWILGTAAGGVVVEILYWGAIIPLGWLLGAAGTIANWTLQSGPITTSTVVLVGWGVTRDLANMFFILILLGIALDYILFQSFGVKRALPMLIVVALLINFSLPIAGIFIDFANVFTDFFMGKITAGCGITEMGQNCGFTEAIANNLDISTLFTSTGVASNILTDIIFAIFFMAGTVFIFLALSLMFLLRTGWLYALLILLPLVLVLMPFPKTSSYFGRWTSKFFQWTFFAPVAAFFLYLSMLIFNANVDTDAVKQLSSAAKSNDGFIEQVYTYIIVWFFMLGSLMAAQAMSITSAGAAMGMIKSAQKWAGGKVKNAGKKVGGEAARMAKIDTGMKKAAEWASRNKVLSTLGVGRGLRGVAVKTEQAMKKQGELTAQEKAKYENMRPNMRMAEYKDLMRSRMPMDRAKAIQLASIMAQKGEFVERDADGEISTTKTDALVREAYETAKTYKDKSAQKALKLSRPTLAMTILEEEWKKDEQDNKISGAIYDPKTQKIIAGRNNITGESFEEAKKAIFDMKMSDFENMRGSWTKEAVQSFIETGALHSGFIKKASDIGDGKFLELAENYLESISKESEKERGKMLEELRKKNPGFYSFITRGGTAADYVIVPDNIRKEGGKEKATSGGTSSPLGV